MRDTELRKQLWGHFAYWALLAVLFFGALNYSYGEVSWALFERLDLGLSLVFSIRFLLGDAIFRQSAKSLLIMTGIGALPLFAFFSATGLAISLAFPFLLLRLFMLPMVFHSMGFYGVHRFRSSFFKMLFSGFVVFVGLHLVSCFWIRVSDAALAGEDRWTTYNKAFYWVITTLSLLGIL